MIENSPSCKCRLIDRKQYHLTQLPMQRTNKSSEKQNEEKLLEKSKESFLEHSEKIEIYYHARIQAKIKAETKVILQQQKGLIHPATFTAILGPSGSGKTTLLNFLSGRLMSDNLIVQGELQFNSQPIPSVQPYSKRIGYVMQQDALLSTLTPRECFEFACNIRMNVSEEEKHKIVEDLILDLGLSGCAEVKVGNAFIKGISGGERKRTSIGVQLITNPSIIFLDQPTTGLDSTTALQVILLLKKLATDGKTVISTVHQPSSQLFCEFDRLMLMVDGRCIYQGAAQQAYSHFEAQGYKCPQLMNASEFYLDMMSITQAEDLEDADSYAEAKSTHDAKVARFQDFFMKSKHHELQPDPELGPLEIKREQEITLFYELYLILFRALLCQVRNPMDVLFKLVQAVFTAVIVFLVFGEIGSALIDQQDLGRLQNIRGVVFFLVASNAFGGIQGTLATFSSERPVFLRERFSKSYNTFTYFVARTAINFPFEVVYPSAGVVIVYWATNFGEQTGLQMFKIIMVMNAVYFCSASYGLVYAALIPKLETAMALVPVLIIPFMLLGGFFINLDEYSDIRVIFYPVSYLSPFKYGFQAGMDSIGVSTKYQPRRPEGLWTNCLIMLGMGLFLRAISVICMQIISNPKRPNMLHLPPSQPRP